MGETAWRNAWGKGRRSRRGRAVLRDWRLCLVAGVLAAWSCATGTAAAAAPAFFDIGIPPNGIQTSYPVVSGDGTIVAATAWIVDKQQEAVRWTEAGGLQELGVLATWGGVFQYSLAIAISADGSTIVGNSSNSDGTNNWTEAFRWTEAEGMVGLGWLPSPDSYGIHGSSAATGVSSNGTVIVGTTADSSIPDAPDAWVEAFRWTAANGMEGLGYLAPYTSGVGYGYSAANAISQDGTTVVGNSSNSDGSTNWYEAFRWTETGGMEGLGYLAPAGPDLSFVHGSNATAVSADGSVIAGISTNTDGTNGWNEAFRWTEATGMEGLGYLAAYGLAPNGFRQSSVTAISADGSTIIGNSSNSDGTNNWTEAFRWTEATGMVGLGYLSSAIRGGSASAVSANGAVIVGASSNQAFRWSEGTGMQSVADWLGPTVDLTNITLSDATGVSADGSTVVGNMYFFEDIGGGTLALEWRAYLARVGGLITEQDAAASFAAAGAVADGASDEVGDAARRGEDCRSFGPRGVCSFASFNSGLDSDNETLSGTGGLAVRVGEHGRAGALVGYARQESDLAFDGHANLEGPEAGLFAGWGADDDRGPQVFAAGAIGWFDADIVRGYANGAGTTTSEGRAGLSSASGYGSFGWGVPFGSTIVAGPFADVTGTTTRRAGYEESGGPFPATFDAASNTSVVTRVGLDAHVALSPALRVSAYGAWAARPLNDEGAIAGSIGGILDLSVNPPAGASDWYEAGADVAFAAANGVAFKAGAEGKLIAGVTKDLNAHVGVSAAF